MIMSSSPNKPDNNNGRDKSFPQYQPQFTSDGMTPSIITTINNTSPTPLIGADQVCNNNETSNRDSRPDAGLKNNARTVEAPPYYESYIEDSFVGHWEREDDDPEYDYKFQRGANDRKRSDEEDESIHPSTIEFDFDSFGPESFIYAPAGSKTITAQTSSSTEAPQVSDKVSEKSELTIQEAESSTVTARHTSADEQNGSSTSPTAEHPSEPPEPVNSPKLCELKPSPVDYLVDPAQIDLKVIEPYKKVISHAGYCHHFDPSAPAPKPGEPAPAIIVFSACYLPDRSRRDYDYVMDHLFLYVLSSLHELIADDYILIYLHNTQPSTTNSSSLSIGASTSGRSTNESSTCSSGQEEQSHQNNLPTFTWMKRCYQMIDRKLRKNLKILYLVKPTFWLKTIVIMCRPFISSKFSKKLRFIENMDSLRKCLPVDELILPASADCL